MPSRNRAQAKRASSSSSSGTPSACKAQPNEPAWDAERGAGQRSTGSAEDLDFDWADAVAARSKELLLLARTNDVVLRLGKKMRIGECFLERELRLHEAFQRREGILRSTWQAQVRSLAADSEEWKQTVANLQETNKTLQANFDKTQEFMHKVQDSQTQIRASHSKMQEDIAKLRSENLALMAEVEQERNNRRLIESELEDARCASASAAPSSSGSHRDRLLSDDDHEEEGSPRYAEGALGPSLLGGRSFRAPRAAPRLSLAQTARVVGKTIASKSRVRGSSAKSKPLLLGRPGCSRSTVAQAATIVQATTQDEALTDPEDLARDPGPGPVVPLSATPSARALSGGQSPHLDFQPAPLGKGAKVPCFMPGEVPTNFWKLPPTTELPDNAHRPVTRSVVRKG